MSTPSAPRRFTPGRILAGCGGLVALLGLGCSSLFTCLPTGLRHGVWVGSCPAGELRQTVVLNAYSLRRGSTGSVQVEAYANYTLGRSDEQMMAPVGRFDVELALLDAAGAEVSLPPREDWTDSGVGRSVGVPLPPELPDGDYKLRATVTSSLGTTVAEAPIALYAPAKVHILTDRPLYEPGNTMSFRAVVLRAADLHPIGKRPGRFVVTDPNGEVLLDEAAPADDWGVAMGTFPIDRLGAQGGWRVAWVSGEDRAEVGVKVEPFTLPRFRLELRPDQPWYRAGGEPIVRGRVVYSSGAPVAQAAVELDWSVAGDWPAPTAWEEPGGLPDKVVTDAEGAFELRLPRIPDDLQGVAHLRASVDATDAAGDRVGGDLDLLLTADPIAVEALTELPGGLVEGFNNRLYLRATTPTGDPLANVDLKVFREWDASDPGVVARTDADGVAALQIDPGPAVNLVIPAKPYRPPPREPAVERRGATDVLRGEDATLNDLLALDRLAAAAERCAIYVNGAGLSDLIVSVDPSGRVGRSLAEDRPAARCLEAVVRGASFSAGAARLLHLVYRLTDEDLAKVEVSVEVGLGSSGDLEEGLAAQARAARTCLPADLAVRGSLGWTLIWQLRAGDRRPTLQWVADGGGGIVGEAAARCLREGIDGVALAEPAALDGMGIARFTLSPSPKTSASRPQDTTMLGYGLSVAALGTDGPMGSTLVRVGPGSVPPLRLRASPVLAAAGGKVEVELLRGPDWSGDLPVELSLRSPQGWHQEAKREKEARTVAFTLPADASGWYEVSAGGAVTRVFVRPNNQLAVDVSSDKAVYRPGEEARLTVSTQAAGKGEPASVTLLGVDESLGQLVPLPGPAVMGDLLPAATAAGTVFSGIDAAVLSRGGVRGENAAAAAVLRIGQIPQPAELDRYVNGSATTTFDPIAPLTEHFYLALGELYIGVHAWEVEAPKGELMQPATMARLWEEALDRLVARELPVDDAYGQRLRLSQLPPDLLTLTDPRMVVLDGTRNPEDVENWAAWVAKEKP